MLNLHVRPVVGRVVDPVASALLRAGVSPDVVTLLGTLGAVTGALVFFPRGSFVVGSAIVALSVLTDLPGCAAPRAASGPGSTAPATGSPTPPSSAASCSGSPATATAACWRWSPCSAWSAAAS
jgi:hypothetical protein